MNPPPIAAARAHGITYRTETEADIPFVRDLYASTRAAEIAATGWPVEMQRAFLDSQFDAQRRDYRANYAAEWLIVEQGGVAVGRLYLLRLVDRHDIIDIAMVESARGQGIGRVILEDILAEAASLGRAVEIHVEANNPARRLYASLGFVATDAGGVYDLWRWTAIS